MSAIRPELIAGKIETGWLDQAASKNAPVTKAQINELLWFLQFCSARKGGLVAMVDELIARHPEQFGNEAMLNIGEPKGSGYTLEQCLTVWKEMSEAKQAAFLRAIAPADIDAESYALAKDALMGNENRNPENFSDFCYLIIDGDITAEKAGRNREYNRKEILAGVERFNLAFLRSHYHATARKFLPAYLESVCVDKETMLSGAYYCPGLVKMLFGYMADHATAVRGTIADTEVSRRIFRELEFAWSQNVPVPIIGESRIGKTSPASAWCAMKPGCARLVTVPESNRIRDFIEAHAEAFGIEHSPATSTASLTAKVKYVHQHSGLMVVYDEAAFLVPVNYTRSTPPTRINYVRCQVIDKDLPCAFFATPQSYRQTLEQYSRVTARKMTEWLGRLAPAVILPPDLDKDDMMAIARIHFPDLPQPYLKLIIARAMQSEGYIKNLEFAAKRALFNARQDGRLQPSIEDVELAIKEMMPQAECVADAPQRTARTPITRPQAESLKPADPPRNRSGR